MSENDGNTKWPCEYCTYHNYSSAIRCTMCSGAKPFVNEDIYRLHGRTTGTNMVEEVEEEQCDHQTATQEKTSAQESQLNQQDSECQNEKQQPGGQAEVKDVHEPLQPLKIEQHSDLAQGPVVEAVVTVVATDAPPIKDSPTTTTTTPTTTTTTPVTAPQVQRVADDAKQNLGKWICRRCTYENWPKSRYCAMCDLAGQTTKAPTQNRPPVADHQQSCGAAAVLIVPPPENEMPAPTVDTGQYGANETAPTNQNAANNCENERRARHMRRNNADWNWLNACLGVIEGDPIPVEAYLASGGNPARTLTASEVSLLNRNSAFDVGHTLVHLAIRFHREDLLAVLLTQIETSGGGGCSGVKRVPSSVAQDLAVDIRRHFSAGLRQRKGSFPCTFVTDFPTFALPAEVDELPGPVQEQLFNELLDKDAQCQLESEPSVINWSIELTVRLGSRLYALWNRSAGDCLLDSVMQATWGVFDRDNALRKALADSLTHSGHVFYARWKEYEASQASFLQYSLDEGQWEVDWASLVSLASQPGASLGQLHVFALAHVLRRPIVVYGVKYVKSFRGEALGLARFEGVYLPLLWEQSFCVRTPIALGYTRGHFSALVPLEPYAETDVARPPPMMRHHDNIAADQLQSAFLPLMDRERKVLPVHFLAEAELGHEETILRQWLDVCETESGILVAQQLLHKRPLLVAQMVEEWLNHYRRLIQMTSGPFVSRPIPIQDYLSEGDTDDE